MDLSRRIVPRTVLASALALAAGATHAQTASTPPPVTLVNANTAFAFDLLAHLRVNTPGNVAFSPASLSLALGMTYAGARGETAAAMARTLHFGSDQASVHAGLHALLAQWQHPTQRGAYQLEIANRIYGERTMAALPAFLDVTRTQYDAPMEQVDWIHAADANRIRINGWVANQTHDRIRNLIPAGAVDERTRMTLVNAIYFHGTWAQAFRQGDTHPQPFHTDAHATVQASMMHAETHDRYAHVGPVQVVELPYRGGDLAFDLVVPDAGTDLGTIESSLDVATWTRWTSALVPATVTLAMPRFRAESTMPATQVLSAMGMGVAFDVTRADFTGITGVQRLAISDVFHKAFVEVNEEGTEAAASTAVVMGTRGAVLVEMHATVVADHPFLYVLRDLRSGEILFVGRVVNPTAT